MKKYRYPGRRLLGLLIAVVFLVGVVPVGIRQVWGEESGEFYIDPYQGAIRPFSFDNSARMTISSERYDKFAWDPTAQGDKNCPHLAMGIKYVVGDNKNPDGQGKWRNVYCLEFEKSSPTGQTMTYVGFTNRKVAYALYYGSVYYGQTSRYAGYSTGDWRMDYFVTQIAIHILNNEFTLAAFQTALNRPGSQATAGEKNLVYEKVKKLVNEANVQGNYGGFTSDGWIDMGAGKFSLTGYQDAWKEENGKYYSQGKFKASFQSYYGYDFREQITSYEVETASGVKVRKSDEKTYSDFDLEISKSQFAKWQLTGKTIPVKVTMKIPRYWGGGIYRCENGVQDVCFLTWSSSGGDVTYTQNVNLHIPKKTETLTIYKKDQDSQKSLAGAVFSLWAYDGKQYGKKVKNFTDNGDGSYTCKGIDYTDTQDGWFLIREEKAPEEYSNQYLLYNSTDQSDYETYGGRQIHMTENGISFDGVEDGAIFLDKKLTPQANLEVKKFDAVSGNILDSAGIAVFEWSKSLGAYREEAVQQLAYEKEKQRYVTKSPLTRTEENEGKFIVKETVMPEGYRCPWSREIQVTEPGLVTMMLDAPNYPVRSVTIQKKVRSQDINWAHGNPTFFFRIWGEDINGEQHEYRCCVELTSGDTNGDFLEKSVTVGNLPAGIYRVEEDGEVLRYILTDMEALTDNVSVEKEELEVVNGIQKIRGQALCDLTLEDGSVGFFNEKVMHDQYTDNQVLVNHIRIVDG